MSSSELENLCETYLAYQTEYVAKDGKGMDRHEGFWAVQKLMVGLSDAADPEDAWKAILLILAKAPPDRVLSALAAGPLEDLIDSAGPQVIDRIELTARQSPEFRSLLSGVWESGAPDVWARIVKARGASW